MQSNDICKYCKYCGMDGVEHCFVNVDSDIFNFEGIEVEPVRHGKWIKLDKPRWFRCSECDNPCSNDFETRLYEYCPHCGARMDGDKW